MEGYSLFARRERAWDSIPEAELQAWIMTQYGEMQIVNPDDGLTFANKTALMIAYERMLESQRPESVRLFNDHLAQYFVGDYGKDVSDCMSLALSVMFDPTKELGFNYEGHICFAGARTKFINDKYAAWIEKMKSHEKLQILNLGAGVDTRAFWDQGLYNKAITYLEVDAAEVNDAKNKVLDGQKQEGKLSGALCDRKVVSMDFSKESVKDLPTKCNEGTQSFNPEVPTCWILEGLVMYLTREVNVSIFKELTALSPKDSYLILNFTAFTPACKPDDDDALLKELGWEKEKRVHFGDEDLNYGRYPEGKKASEIFGFSLYKKL